MSNKLYPRSDASASLDGYADTGDGDDDDGSTAAGAGAGAAASVAVFLSLLNC